jgi:hypothetical protein
MEFNEHQINLWKSMIKLIDEYSENKVNFNYLVSSLEGLLDTSEIKDKDIIKEWYDFWTPLEMINAETEIIVSDKEKERVTQEMKKYLLRKLTPPSR